MQDRTHKSRFNEYQDSTIINKCEQYAKWTLPYLAADVEITNSTGRVVVERDFQELGALFVNHLASKLARLLFPTQYPFFQASASSDFVEHARKRGVDEAALRGMFSRMEMASNKRLFLNSGYAALILCLRHLIVTGNVLLYRDSEKGTLTAYGLRSFGARRDGAGDLLDVILQEFTVLDSLPEDVQIALRTAQPSKYVKPDTKVEKYTRINRRYRNGTPGYEVTQEVDCIKVGTPSWYPVNMCPWMLPTWTLIPGEHYGRGHVEDFAGGFAKLSALSESATLYGIEIMRVLNLVGASAGSDIDNIATSDSGEWVRGDPANIKAYESGDAQKLRVVEAQIEGVVARLSKAFMYTGAAPRDAERVTAYELELAAQEAEYALGGVYSTLSGGIQVPMAHLLLVEVSDIALPGIISGDLEPDITAGIPALGRSSDVQNLLMATQELGAVLPVVQLDNRINPKKVVDIILAGRSIDQTTLFYTPEEQQANAEAAMAEQAAQQNLALAGTLAEQGDQLAQVLAGSQ